MNGDENDDSMLEDGYVETDENVSAGAGAGGAMGTSDPMGTGGPMGTGATGSPGSNMYSYFGALKSKDENPKFIPLSSSFSAFGK